MILKLNYELLMNSFDEEVDETNIATTDVVPYAVYKDYLTVIKEAGLYYNQSKIINGLCKNSYINKGRRHPPWMASFVKLDIKCVSSANFKSILNLHNTDNYWNLSIT